LISDNRDEITLTPIINHSLVALVRSSPEREREREGGEGRGRGGRRQRLSLLSFEMKEKKRDNDSFDDSLA
jgi:hypothetical protein